MDTNETAAHGAGAEPEEYWFCLTHHRVEPRQGCRNADRLGPYATREEAAHALERVEERNQAWEDDTDETDDPPR